MNGAKVLGRIIRVDHVEKYKKKEEEDEEELQKKREERGVCYAFQKGECNRGDACKYSHDEQVSILLLQFTNCYSIFLLGIHTSHSPSCS